MARHKPKRPPQSAATAESAVALPGWQSGVYLALILLATVVAYSPALSGGMLWDDDAHITRPELRSLDGLYRIWFDVRSTFQYYPLLHSAFWFEHKLWGDTYLGYHLATLGWHLLAVSLLYFVLVRLKIPGALLAAALFALHPVMVESVAWMSEQKNTLSAVFCLSAMLAYLKFDETRQWSSYALALCLFILGLLSKTVITATLPAALLVVFWWQRGSVSWKQDVRPLVPFFLFGAAGGLVTAWVERKLIGAEGMDFELTFLQRCLMAGRVPWFYLSKLVWPANLVFVYPRWDLDPRVCWQWLFPIATLGVFVGLWALRAKWRGPLAAWLIFIGELVPVLGFLNVYPFLFSFVADHFQYMAAVAIFVLIAACIATGLERGSSLVRQAGVAVCILLVATLAITTFKQSRMYGDVVTFYRTILKNNPHSWSSHNNLGTLLASQGKQREAVEHYRAAIRLRPNYFRGHLNLGKALADTGQFPEAFDHLHKAIELAPDLTEAHLSLGDALTSVGRHTEAVNEFKIALALRPDDPLTLNSLGNALAAVGQLPQAIERLQRAVSLKPTFADAHVGLGNALVASGNSAAGIAELKKATELAPTDAWTFTNLGIALVRVGRNAEAIDQFNQAMQLNPSASAHNNLGAALMKMGRVSDAINEFQAALAVEPDFTESVSNLANALTQTNRFPEAVEHLRRVVQRMPESADAHNALGMAFMRDRKFPQAIEEFRQVVKLNPNYLESHNYLGALLVTNGDVSTSLTQLEEAVRLQPDSADAHQRLGELLQLTGRYDVAATQYREAIRLDPKLVQAYANLAQVLKLTNHRQEAIATAEKGIEVARAAGDNALAAQLEQWLAQTRAGE